MKILLILLLTGCTIYPFQEPTYKERLNKCIHDFVGRYNTNIKNTYIICKRINSTQNQIKRVK
jgi:hypothetical protein